MFWFSLQFLSETFLILCRIKRDIVIRVLRSSSKVPLFLSDFNETSNFLDRSSKITRTPNFMKFLPVGAELFRGDGHTGVTKLTDALRSSANASKTC